MLHLFLKKIWILLCKWVPYNMHSLEEFVERVRAEGCTTVTITPECNTVQWNPSTEYNLAAANFFGVVEQVTTTQFRLEFSSKMSGGRTVVFCKTLFERTGNFSFGNVREYSNDWLKVMLLAEKEWLFLRTQLPNTKVELRDSLGNVVSEDKLTTVHRDAASLGVSV